MNLVLAAQILCSLLLAAAAASKDFGLPGVQVRAGARALNGGDESESRICLDAASTDFGDGIVSAGRDLSWRRVRICPSP